jgi:hypothetical protein
MIEGESFGLAPMQYEGGQLCEICDACAKPNEKLVHHEWCKRHEKDHKHD